MKIEREIIIDSSINKAWKVLGTEFADAYKWASVVNHSESKGGSLNGSSCSERSCDISGMGKTREKLISYSDAEHSLCYTVPEGMPKMVKHATNSWQLVSLGTDKTKLKMEMNLTLGGFMGFMMRPMMNLMMRKMAKGITDDFKFYVENGRPGKAKLKAMEKYKR
ncbi:MAG: SRPBCC family protein [Bacteroidetes bacterium]|nr:SRPBCC family protein [Bacteroidota bacterium]